MIGFVGSRARLLVQYHENNGREWQGTFKLLDFSASPPAERVLVGPVDRAIAITDGKWLATCSPDGALWLWDLTADELTGTPLEGAGCDDHQLAPEQGFAITGGYNQSLRLWNTHANPPQPLSSSPPSAI